MAKIQLIGGHFQDAEGNVLANGYLKMKLSQDANVGGVNVAAGVEITIQLDASGDVVSSPAQSVWGNDALSPVNTFYRVTAFTASGQPVWGPNNQQVLGSGTFDLSTWVPNQIISWTPPLQVPELEVNGTPNADQTLLNLTEGAGISIVDNGGGDVEIISTNTGPTFSTPGQGGFIGPGYPLDSLITYQMSQITVSSTLNQLTVWQFQTYANFTISKITARVVTGTGGAHFNVGIYDATGNKLIDSGLLDASTSGTTVTTTLGTPVTLPPGTYYYAHSSDNGGIFVLGFTPNSPVVATTGLINLNATRVAQAANLTSAGTMPLTLGALTADGNFTGPTAAFFEV